MHFVSHLILLVFFTSLVPSLSLSLSVCPIHSLFSPLLSITIVLSGGCGCCVAPFALACASPAVTVVSRDVIHFSFCLFSLSQTHSMTSLFLIAHTVCHFISFAGPFALLSLFLSLSLSLFSAVQQATAEKDQVNSSQLTTSSGTEK